MSGRRNALDVPLQQRVDELLGDSPPAPEVEVKATPHARKRPARQVSLTFPSAEWVEAVGARAERWEVRKSDFLVWCVAVAFAALEAGEVEQPNTMPAQFHQRAGECMELPWEPDNMV